jgi:hypothetical protein
MNKKTTLFFIVIFLSLFSRAQLRTPQGIYYPMEGLSPLNEIYYFEALHRNYNLSHHLEAKLNQRHQNKKIKRVRLVGFRDFMKPNLSRRKIWAPMPVKYDSIADDLNRSIPAGLGPSQSEGEVLKRFGDQAIQNWLKSPAVKGSSFGKAASSVEGAMKMEASISSAPLTPGAPAIDHKFTFQYMALQSQTKMEYKGWTNATIRHDASVNETAMEVSEKVFKNKDLVVSHVKNPIEDRSSLGLRWNW